MVSTPTRTLCTPREPISKKPLLAQRLFLPLLWLAAHSSGPINAFKVSFLNSWYIRKWNQALTCLGLKDVWFWRTSIWKGTKKELLREAQEKVTFYLRVMELCQASVRHIYSLYKKEEATAVLVAIIAAFIIWTVVFKRLPNSDLTWDTHSLYAEHSKI